MGETIFHKVDTLVIGCVSSQFDSRRLDGQT